MGCGDDDGDGPDAAPAADADPTAPDAVVADAATAVDANGVDAGAPAADATPSAFPAHSITRDCAPNDGPALRIDLGDAVAASCHLDGTGPSVSITVYVGSVDPPATINLSDGISSGSGFYCLGGTAPCVFAIGGEIHFDTFTADVGATGTYRLELGDDEESGSFDAVWCQPDTPVFCG